MKAESIKKLLMAIGVEEGDIHIRGDWVNTNCPLAPWTHENGIDERPSFGISISEGPSFYHCFGCMPGYNRHISNLIQVVWLHSGAYPFEAARILFGEKLGLTNGNGLKDIKSGLERRIKNVDPLPKSLINKYDYVIGARHRNARAVYEYLKRRGVNKSVIKKCGIRFCTKREGMYSAFTDKSGKIFRLRVRLVSEKIEFAVNPEVAEKDTGLRFGKEDFPSMRNVGAWFGMHLVNWNEPVMLVEGEIDCMRLKSLGYSNAIASGGIGITREQFRALDSALQVILGYDNDKAGRQVTKRILREGFLDRRVAKYEADWGIVSCKDPGELPDKEALNEVISNIERVR